VSKLACPQTDPRSSSRRTTLSLDDDVLAAARALAVIQRRTVGEVVSELARGSLTEAGPRRSVRNGVPLWPRRSGLIVTSEMVRRLNEGIPRSAFCPQ
jgi:hypothetical protein